jgi:hypothetical protein
MGVRAPSRTNPVSGFQRKPGMGGLYLKKKRLMWMEFCYVFPWNGLHRKFSGFSYDQFLPSKGMHSAGISRIMNPMFFLFGFPAIEKEPKCLFVSSRDSPDSASISYL